MYKNDSRYGWSVDLVGHSMGGLIIRAALTGTERHMEGWPPFRCRRSRRYLSWS
ncbi:PGAP1-like alpha/beta domain-containing protein [Streptomyces sp. CB02400]|uniref:PGAP1-like alpha/beta domain-containing protein n=1 Tax=Streptomyces sp. CB02400 TaxID=1703944 RepID=UPI003FA7E042